MISKKRFAETIAKTEVSKSAVFREGRELLAKSADRKEFCELSSFCRKIKGKWMRLSLPKVVVVHRNTEDHFYVRKCSLTMA